MCYVQKTSFATLLKLMKFPCYWSTKADECHLKGKLFSLEQFLEPICWLNSESTVQCGIDILLNRKGHKNSLELNKRIKALIDLFTKKHLSWKKINKHCTVQSTQMLLGRQSGSSIVVESWTNKVSFPTCIVLSFCIG